MRLGLIADVHGNRVALDAVLADMPPVDRLLCAGDVVGYNPWPGECIKQLQAGATPTIQGNHDRAVASGVAPGFNHMARAGVEHAREVCTREQQQWLRDLPVTRTVAGGRVRIAHGHPDDPDHYTRPAEFGPELLGTEEALVLGHTHVQHHEVYERGIVVNPGSVGQPRDGDSRAAYSVLDLEERTVTDHRVEYDVPAVQRAVHEAGLPDSIGTRLADGR